MFDSFSAPPPDSSADESFDQGDQGDQGGSAPKSSAAKKPEPVEDFDDDIPF